MDNNKNCDSCDSCYSCYSCNSCNSCNYCDSCYSCYYCKGLRMSERMIFCLGEGSYEKEGEGYQKNNRIFNVQLTEEEWDKVNDSLPDIKIPICRWIKKEDMTDDEKDSVSGWRDMGGYLKTLSYEEAWKVAWKEMPEEDKKAILNLPHFDKDIFKEITGIDVNEEDEVKITVDGKDTYISRKSAKALNLI